MMRSSHPFMMRLVHCRHYFIFFGTNKPCFPDTQRKSLRRLVRPVLCRTLVTQLSPTTSLLRAEQNDNEIYLIGTAHVSQQSATEVSDLIDLVQPQTVFIELDPPRAARLIHDHADQFEVDFAQAATRLSQHLPAQILSGSEKLLGDYIRGFYQTLKRYGLVPGVDMLAGIQAGQRVGATLYYGDRDAQETLRELTVTLRNPATLLRGMATPVPPDIQQTFQQAMMARHDDSLQNLGERVEQIKSRDYASQMTDWMTRAFPETADALIHRRDIHMGQNLRRHCSQGKVVAIVGIAHMEGIEREWSRLGKEGIS